MEQSTVFAARVDRWSRGRPLLVDGLLAGVIWLVFGLLSLLAGPTGLAVATATVLPLAWRRKRPAALLAWTAAVFVVQLVVLPIPLPANIAQALMIYTVAAHVASLAVRLGALGAALAGSLAAGFRWSTAPDYTRNAFVIAAFLAVFAGLIWLIGNVVRGRETNTRALGEAYARLEESRRQRERFLAQRERVEAAREIHDIVAHSLTVVVVQADGAEYAAEHAQPWDRTDARAVLATIGRTARTALAEVRGVIDVLRDPEGADDPAGPSVGLADLGRLVAAVRAAGLRVEIRADPAVFERTPAAVRLAVLRVVRESLTNVLKHAGAGATARVVVERTPGAVRVRVEDDGAGPAPGVVAAGPGHGLGGMRERLRALDGALAAGPRPGGGFGVEATVPVAAGGGRP
ncbi:sensor histidine kinase [Amorphoplanes nipponensis]|uniref:histidine kinase n=1 Tax=Actinoplanes nipponensis TaxID=135950 RepID=A0A919JEX4_9ACTN|nr:histidine kinase [Actinoplanes nipponensis]GIE48085.1 two-component sensor histidine kinase [Actinoplanes nipponensis]